MTRKRISPGSKLPLDFTSQEWVDLTEHTFIELELISAPTIFGSRRRVEWSLDDIEDAMGHVAATLNHTDDAKLKRRLSKVFGRLQKLLDQYDDQSDYGAA